MKSFCTSNSLNYWEMFRIVDVFSCWPFMWLTGPVALFSSRKPRQEIFYFAKSKKQNIAAVDLYVPGFQCMIIEILSSSLALKLICGNVIRRGAGNSVWPMGLTVNDCVMDRILDRKEIWTHHFENERKHNLYNFNELCS